MQVLKLVCEPKSLKLLTLATIWGERPVGTFRSLPRIPVLAGARGRIVLASQRRQSAFDRVHRDRNDLLGGFVFDRLLRD
jgi:hypothetical protein